MIVAGLLITPPDEAVIVTVPSAPVFPVALTEPAETVAICVLLDVHCAILVMSTEPLHVFALAESVTTVFPPLLSVPLVGVTVIDEMQPTVTVTVCVPVMEGLSFEVAVTVAEPVVTDVTRPLALIVAVLVGLMLQLTEGRPVLPSSNVPVANICTVLFVLPV